MFEILGPVGASSYPCSNVYKGVSPFSEKESVAIKLAVESVKSRVLVSNYAEIFSILNCFKNLNCIKEHFNWNVCSF